MPKLPSYVTKSDLKTALDDQEKSMLRKIDDKLMLYRDEVLTKFDAIMKELETMREENTLGVYQTNNLQKKVDDHEKRITKLESA